MKPLVKVKKLEKLEKFGRLEKRLEVKLDTTQGGAIRIAIDEKVK